MNTEPKVKRALRAYYDRKGFKEKNSTEGHETGWDLVFRDRGGGSFVFVEAKGEGKAKTGMENNTIHGLGQIVTRFKDHRNYTHCLALPANWKRRAMGKVSKDVLQVLRLIITFVDASGHVEEVTWHNYDEVLQNLGQAAHSSVRNKAEGGGLLNAAIKILSRAGKPMRCQPIVDMAVAKGYWRKKKGRTPASTLYSAITRDIAAKGSASRFRKVGRGLFALTSAR